MDLQDRLLAAHAHGDKARLAELYQEAADRAETIDAECFFLTQAYVFALDAGDDRANDLHARLLANGREA